MTDNTPEIEIKTYNECLELVQKKLKEIASKHGAIKDWCRANSLDYNTIIKIKNGNLTYYLPQLINDLLNKLGYRSSFTRDYLQGQQTEDIYTIINEKQSSEPS